MRGDNMLLCEATEQMALEWKEVRMQYQDRLHANRKPGAAVAGYLIGRYPVEQLQNETAAQVVTGNVLANKPFADKLPVGASPSPVTYFVQSTGTGKALYEKQDPAFKGQQIFVGIDLTSGYFCVEGSSALWDELYACRGLDEADLQNDYCVAEYISCLKKFGLLEQVLG